MAARILFPVLIGILLLPSPAMAQVAGGALLCDGVDDYVTIPDLNGDFDMGSAMTVEAWVRHDVFNDFGSTVSSFSSAFALGQGQLALALKPHFTVSIPATNSAVGPDDLPPGVWTHLAGSYDGSTLRVYVNGMLVDTQPHSGSANAVTAIRFCRFSHSAFFLTGAIDEIRIWDVVRTEPQIAGDRHRTLSGSEPGLVGYYRFDEASGQTVLDSSAAGNDGFLGTSVSSELEDPTRIPSGAPLVNAGAGVSVVYENTTTDHGSISSGVNPEVGDQITLEGTARLVTQFEFFTGVGFTPVGGEAIQIRFYENDGPIHVTNGEPRPGTLRYDSGPILLSVSSGSELITLPGLSVEVPDTFTWSAEFIGVTDGFAGLRQYDPPSAGSSANFYWFKNTLGNWFPSTGSSPYSQNVYARVIAEPAPPVPALGLLGRIGFGLALAAGLWLRRARKQGAMSAFVPPDHE